MSTLGIVALVVVAVLLALAIGGAVANVRRRSRPEEFASSVERVDRALAAAHAADEGWEPEALYATARRELEARRPGVQIHDLALVAVMDPPGTDDDKATFRFRTDDGDIELTLSRAGGQWTGAPG